MMSVSHAADLLLIPNLPAPLSIYCNNMLMDSLQRNAALIRKTLSFYNMVQVHKTLHKQYLDNRQYASWMLNNYIPFYSDIELITLTKESIFHHSKECKAIHSYNNLWIEICERMQWQIPIEKGMVIEIEAEQSTNLSLIRHDPRTGWGEASAK